MTSGIMPLGIPRKLQIGDMNEEIPSAAPLALNRERETISRVIVGKMLTIVFNPSEAPFVNELMRELFLIKQRHIAARINGTVAKEMISAV